MFANLPSHGLYCRHVNGLRLRSVEYVLEEPDMRPALMFDDVKNLDIDSFAAPAPPSGRAVMRLKQVRRAFIRGCSASPGTGTYLQVEGEETEKITVMGNDFTEAASPLHVGDEVKRGTVFESGNRMPVNHDDRCATNETGFCGVRRLRPSHLTAARTRNRIVQPRRNERMRRLTAMHVNVLLLGLVLPAVLAQTPVLRLNKQEYFEMPGLNVMAFQDAYPEGHQSGVSVIQNGERVGAMATCGSSLLRVSGRRCRRASSGSSTPQIMKSQPGWRSQTRPATARATIQSTIRTSNSPTKSECAARGGNFGSLSISTSRFLIAGSARWDLSRASSGHAFRQDMVPR